MVFLLFSCKIQRKWSNISHAEKKVIKELKEKNYIGLPSDKGTEFCVIQQDTYTRVALAHLNDSSTYQKIPRMSAKTVENKVNSTWKKVCLQNEIPSFVRKSFIAGNTDLPRFYHLIKTHKTGPAIKIRPIVSNTNGPTQRLSWLLANALKPLLKDVPAHLENSLELIKYIQAGDFTTNKTLPYPCSLDVVSLYTSIPRENEGTEREAQGVGRDMSCPRKLFLDERKSVFRDVRMQSCLALRFLVKRENGDIRGRLMNIHHVFSKGNIQAFRLRH